MAGLGRGWTKALAVAVLLMGAGGVGFAQSRLISNAGAGSLSGKLTDLYSKPLDGVPLVLRNQATGAEARATTTKSGAYEFRGLEPGEYTLEAGSPQRGRGRLEGIVVNAAHEARVQAAMEFEPLLLNDILEAAQAPNRPEPRLIALPLSDATLALEPLQAMALAGRSLRSSTLPAVAASALPASVSAPARTAANQSRLLEAKPMAPALEAPRPVLAVSHQSDPVASATTAMSAEQLQALPISGRHWQDFVLDNTPTSATPAGGQAQTVLQGASQQAEIAVDGASKGLAFGSTNPPGQESSGQGALGQDGAGPAGMAQVGAGGHGLALSEAAIRTVRAEAGNVESAASGAAGGRMNVETQHGGNELHGQASIFVRQNSWEREIPLANGRRKPRLPR